MMLLGLGSSALFAALMALTDNVLAFVIIRFLAGWASAFMMIFLSMIVFPRLLAAGRNDLQSVHFGGVGLGIAVSSLMTGALAMVEAGWRAGWMGAALISAVGFVATYLLVDKGRSPPARLRVSRPCRKAGRCARSSWPTACSVSVISSPRPSWLRSFARVAEICCLNRLSGW